MLLVCAWKACFICNSRSRRATLPSAHPATITSAQGQQQLAASGNSFSRLRLCSKKLNFFHPRLSIVQVEANRWFKFNSYVGRTSAAHCLIKDQHACGDILAGQTRVGAAARSGANYQHEHTVQAGLSRSRALWGSVAGQRIDRRMRMQGTI